VSRGGPVNCSEDVSEDDMERDISPYLSLAARSAPQSAVSRVESEIVLQHHDYPEAVRSVKDGPYETSVNARRPAAALYRCGHRRAHHNFTRKKV
jgi:hypothetical protein